MRSIRLGALNGAAQLLATSTDSSVRNGAEAIMLAKRAASVSGGRDPATLDTLAAAYAEAGRFPEAVETVRRALALASDRQLAEALRAHLALCQSGTRLRK